jgi:hypothetical protein
LAQAGGADKAGAALKRMKEETPTQ